MTTKIQKWGNSLAVRLPKNLARALSFRAGTPVSIKQEWWGVRIVPKKTPEPTLEELVAQITPENRYEKIDWGPRRGNEIW
ncbi:MAG: AbrB/MazE/SpoVT family DNA-binding domain-containing protein [Parcubacteria group bacterium]|nr:AbrB/MazE/SpoVT family DNA-binding domain-containing protein [Parcubacteria group bacterium]